MTTAVLPSQTLEEILYYLEFQGIEPLSRTLVMRGEAMVVAVSYQGAPGENQELLFEPVQASLLDRDRVLAPSKLLDAGQWLELSDRYAKKTDGSTRDLELAAACMEEALRLGADEAMQTRLLPGMASGWLQQQLGYPGFFAWVCACTLPSVVVAAFVRIPEGFGRKADDHSSTP